MHMRISFSDFWGFACNEYLIKVDHKRGKTNIRGDSKLQIPNYAFYVNIQIIMYRLLITTNASFVTIGTDILALVNEIDS